MNNKESPTMETVTALTKFLIDTWRGTKCPDPRDCNKCKYNELCAKIAELES